MKPLFTHDCERCRFLGSVISPETSEVSDLYVCEGGTLGQTVVARWSSLGPDYSSCPVGIQTTVKTLQAAKLLAGL